MTQKMQELLFQWDAPQVTDADGNLTLYDKLAGYEIHHNLPGFASPYVTEPGVNSSAPFELPEGTYSIAIQTINTEGQKSEKLITNFSVANVPLHENIKRTYGVSLGGALSTNTSLTTTGSSTKFELEDTTGWAFAGGGAPQVINTFIPGDPVVAARFEQDISDIEALDFDTMTPDEAAIKSHYILFDSDSSTDPWKLVRWHDNVYATNNIGVGYWYDTGSGDDGTTSNAEATFINRTGSVTVAAGSNSVVGVDTLFTTEYAIDDIIYFNNQRAAKVAYIRDDTTLTIDRTFTDATSTASGSLKRQGLRVDINYDAIIYTIRRQGDVSSSVFNKYPVELDIDPSVFTGQGIRQTTIYKLNDDTLTTNDFGDFDDPLSGAEAGWAMSLPATVNNLDEIYSSSRTFTSDGLSPQDDEWSTPVVIHKRVDGQGVKNVCIYKLNDSTLTSNTFGTYANPLYEAEAGWATTNPGFGENPDDGDTIYESCRTFTDDEEDPHENTWSDPVVYSKFTKGDSGSSSITVQLSRPSISISALHTGVVTEDGYDNSGTKIYVWEGNDAREYDGSGTSNGTWTVSAAGTNITPSSTITDSGDYATVGDHSNMTDNDAVVTYTITGKRSDGTALPVTTVEQHLVKTLYGEGVTGPDGKRTVMGYLYYRKSYANGTTAPSAPSGVLYKFSTREVSGTGITSGTAADSWHNDPVPFNADSDDTWWIVQYSGIEATAGSTEFDITYDDVSSHISFDGIVTFTNSTNISDGTYTREIPTSYFVEADVQSSLDNGTTTIDGDHITTGTISGARISLANVTEANRATEASDLAGKMGGYNLSATEIVGAQGTRIRVGKTTPSSTTAGYWLGAVNNSDNHQFHVGNATDSIYWDGTDLTIKGTIAADTFRTALANDSDEFDINGRCVQFGSGSQAIDPDNVSTTVNVALIASYGKGGTDPLKGGIVGLGGRFGVAGSTNSNITDSGGIYGQHTLSDSWGWLGHKNGFGVFTSSVKAGASTFTGAITGTSATFSTTLGVTGTLTGGVANFSGAVEANSLTLNGRSLYINDAGLSFPSYSTSAVGEVLKVASRSGNVIGLEWAAESGGGGGASALNDLTDVSTSGLASGKVLKYNGSSWVPQDDEGTTYTGTAPIVVSGTAITFAGTSAEVAAGVSDKTGSGALVFATSPTLVTPALGTPASGNLANCTFPTLNQSTTQNAGTATKLAATKTIGMTGDVVWTSEGFDGSGNVTGTATIQANSVALGTDTTGNYMSAITQGTGVTVTHTPGEGSSGAIAIGQPVATGSNVRFNAIGVNETNTTQGTITATGTITGSDVTADSDIRLKSEIHTIEDALEKVSKMRGVTYIKDFEPGSGVVAQELEKIAPELVKENKYKSVAYGNLVGYLIEAIKELKDKVEELENGNSSD